MPDPFDVVVTRHAAKRVRERAGLNKRAVKRAARHARRHGLRVRDLHGDVRKYLEDKRDQYRKQQGAGFVYRLTPMGVWVFRDGCLVTLVKLRPGMAQQVVVAWTRKKRKKGK